MKDKITFMASGSLTIWRGNNNKDMELVTPFFSHLRRYSNCGIPESMEVIKSNNGVELSLEGAAELLNQMAADLDRLRKLAATK